MLQQLGRNDLLDFIICLNGIIGDNCMDNLLVYTNVLGAIGNLCLGSPGLTEKQG